MTTEISLDELYRRVESDLAHSKAANQNMIDALEQIKRERDDARDAMARGYVVPGLDEAELRSLLLDDGNVHTITIRVNVEFVPTQGFRAADFSIKTEIAG